MDNHSAHTSKETRRFLDTIPKGRFKFVFTPKHGLWINMIESFFSKMTKQMLRGIRVNTKEELVERIHQYFDEVNREPVIYHCQRPTKLGYTQGLWALTSLHKHIQKNAENTGYPRLATVVKLYIQKFLKGQNIKPLI